MSRRSRALRRFRGKGTTKTAGFPLDRTDDRVLPPDFQGVVVTSDIDKTYLATEFDSFRKLLKTALEPASDKECVRGMDWLLRALRRGGHARPEIWPLYFVSASPPQMRKVLEEKMLLDGILSDGVTFKDQWQLLKDRRPAQIKEHRLYKLTALLMNRARRPLQASIQEILVGDDSETDAETYQIYAQLLEGSLSLDGLTERARAWGANQGEQEQLRMLAERRDRARVSRIYIHRTERRPLDSFSHLHSQQLFFGETSFCLALDALDYGFVRLEEVLALVTQFSRESILKSLETRERLSPGFVERFPAVTNALQVSLLSQDTVPTKNLDL